MNLVVSATAFLPRKKQELTACRRRYDSEGIFCKEAVIFIRERRKLIGLKSGGKQQHRK
jgi:hypothetical protein